MGEDAYLVVVLLLVAISLALSLDYWGRENKQIPRINQRFAVEFMLRTGSPTPPADLELLRGKQTVAVRDENGEARSWIVRRRRAMFTIAPA